MTVAHLPREEKTPSRNTKTGQSSAESRTTAPTVSFNKNLWGFEKKRRANIPLARTPLNKTIALPCAIQLKITCVHTMKNLISKFRSRILNKESWAK